MNFEFKAKVAQNGQISIPTEIAGQIPAGTELNVVLAWGSTSVETSSYHALGTKLHEASAYAASAEETVYDSLA